MAPNDKNFIKFDSTTRQISVYSQKDEDEGTYYLSLSVTPTTFGLPKTFPLIINVTNPCLKTIISASSTIPDIMDVIPTKPFYEFPIQFYHSAQNTTNCGAIEAKVRDV